MTDDEGGERESNRKARGADEHAAVRGAPFDEFGLVAVGEPLVTRYVAKRAASSRHARPLRRRSAEIA
jgi:hypothetical protein